MARMGESKTGCRCSFEQENRDQCSSLSFCSPSPGSAGIRAGAKAIVCWRGERAETGSSALPEAGRRRMEEDDDRHSAGACVCVCRRMELVGA